MTPYVIGDKDHNIVAQFSTYEMAIAFTVIGSYHYSKDCIRCIENHEAKNRQIANG